MTLQRRHELETEADGLEGELLLAKTRAKTRGEYADPEWFVSTQLRIKQLRRQAQAIGQELKAKNLHLLSFYIVARDLLPKVEFEQIERESIRHKEKRLETDRANRKGTCQRHSQTRPNALSKF